MRRMRRLRMPDTPVFGLVVFRRPSGSQFRQLDEIVSGHRPDELEVELFDAAQHGSGEPADSRPSRTAPRRACAAAG